MAKLYVHSTGKNYMLLLMSKCPVSVYYLSVIHSKQSYNTIEQSYRHNRLQIRSISVHLMTKQLKAGFDKT